MTETFYGAWLNAWAFWLCLSLGCLGLLLLTHTLRPAWGAATLRAMEAGASTLPLMLVLYIPILLGGMPHLYPWAAHGAHAPVLQHRAPYMNLPFFIVRCVVYFGVWIGLATYLSRSARWKPEAFQARSNVSAPALVAFVLTVTFAFTDWVMATEEHWSSTIFGIWFLTGQALAGVALITLWYTRTSLCSPVILKDLGNLLLAFTMFWAYISLSQYLIIWSGNLPEEASYYLDRSRQGWQILGGFLALGQFLLPFLALLSGKTKRSPYRLALVAAWILAMRVLDLYWIVVPSVRHGSVLPRSWEVMAFIIVGVLWVVVFRLRLRGAVADRMSHGEVGVHA